MTAWWNKKQAQPAQSSPTKDVVEGELQPASADASQAADKGGWLTRWRGAGKREQQLATLQDGFNELVGLTRSIREHMDAQARTQKALLDSMQHLPDAVEGLKGVGKATAQQTETLDLLRRQLEGAARHEQHLADSMRNFNDTLKVMDDLSQRTSQTVTSMADRTRDSEEVLRSILERSERRLMTIIITLMIVTVAVAGVGLYLGFSDRSPQPERAPAAMEESAVPAQMETAPVKEYRISALSEDESAATEEDASPDASSAADAAIDSTDEPMNIDVDTVEAEVATSDVTAAEAAEVSAATTDEPMADTTDEAEMAEQPIDESDLPAVADEADSPTEALEQVEADE
jgi:uncharacterized protein YigA (DUF484 family)